MVTGSVVSSLQGEPRSTHDIDFVILLERQAVPLLSQSFRKDVFYLNEASMYDAIDRRSMFDLLDSSSGNKVDFWLLTDEAFDQSRFARRQYVPAMGIDNFCVTTPEDTILSKLRWAKVAGGSEKQVTDAIRVFEMQFDRLDIDYIKYWITQMDLQTQWDILISQADPY
jgi:hypothetical protein